MARTKQSRPVERLPSSEYISGQTKGASPSPAARQSNGVAMSAAKDIKSTPAAHNAGEAGVTQLLIAVGGIYGSLYETLLCFGQ